MAPREASAPSVAEIPPRCQPQKTFPGARVLIAAADVFPGLHAVDQVRTHRHANRY